jgi:FixJ family two-component response regulator
VEPQRVTAASPTIHIVDDDAAFRTAIGRLLTLCGYSVALYESAAQLLAAPAPTAPGCILLDVRMNGLTGPQLQSRLAELGNRLPIIFVTGHGDIATSVRAIKAGAEDFLTKPVTKEKLLASIALALEEDALRRTQDDELDGLRARVARLTPRENEVFALVVRGKLNKQIAGELGTSERTVKAHRQKVMEKCEVRSLAELVQLADRLGAIATPVPTIAPKDNTRGV